MQNTNLYSQTGPQSDPDQSITSKWEARPQLTSLDFCPSGALQFCQTGPINSCFTGCTQQGHQGYTTSHIRCAEFGSCSPQSGGNNSQKKITIKLFMMVHRVRGFQRSKWHSYNRKKSYNGMVNDGTTKDIKFVVQ